jgi:hypothetical protein
MVAAAWHFEILQLAISCAFVKELTTMPNSAQNSMPNNSQDDREVKLFWLLIVTLSCSLFVTSGVQPAFSLQAAF